MAQEPRERAPQHPTPIDRAYVRPAADLAYPVPDGVHCGGCDGLRPKRALREDGGDEFQLSRGKRDAISSDVQPRWISESTDARVDRIKRTQTVIRAVFINPSALSPPLDETTLIWPLNSPFNSSFDSLTLILLTSLIPTSDLSHESSEVVTQESLDE
eukprot:CAMPEP_0118635184 /NCGR_PEP_ID=MMETSP0785-20121206/1942_1 /TAXON_ID=91992 /ORGANISM="Bolidomonas pacifica, Strain CCMP 1866" /LENGTH=157 /DNA_ID=CAMNT_0006526203 /DNA_START=406 /DNA_END=880 /DNA_ORIENTATION=-